MRILALPSSIQRLASRFLTADSRTHILLILSGFIALRVFLSLKNGIVPEGDGLQEGVMLGRFWLGDLTFKQLLDPAGLTGAFLRQRSTQLLFPLLVSPQPIIGWDIRTHLLVLNTILGSVLVVASYVVGFRLQGKSYGVLVALLMFLVTGLYWIARAGLVDNVFYAVLPLFALSIVTWLQHKTVKNLALMILGTGALALTRPESFPVIGFVALVFVWKFLRRRFSRRAVAAALLLSFATAAIGTILFVQSSPSLQRTLLSTSNVSWGLAMSTESLFNRGQKEFDQILAKSNAMMTAENLSSLDLGYRRSIGAIEVIKANPLWYLLKIPLRGLALLFPWTYQIWSLPHVLYEAVYTIFLMTGFVLLLRRGTPGTSLLVLVAIPLSILCFLSVFGIDNDLKHRNGILVGLNLVAPLGYFLKPRAKNEAAHGLAGSPPAIGSPSRATSS